MRRTIVFMIALILLLAFGIQSVAQPDPQYRPNDPRYRPNDPRNQRNEPMRGDRRSYVGQLSADLVRQAEYLSQTSFQYFLGWNGVITNEEQSILFKTEEFTAACRLFNRLAQETNYFQRDSLRTNLYNASRYLAAAFRALEGQMRMGGMRGDFNGMRRDGRRFEGTARRRGVRIGRMPPSHRPDRGRILELALIERRQASGRYRRAWISA